MMRSGFILAVSVAALAGCTARDLSPEASGPPTRGVPNELVRMIGKDAGPSEKKLTELGYDLAGTGGLIMYWWSDSNGTCARIINTEGRYTSVEAVEPERCGR